MALVTKIYQITKSFPRTETYSLISQIRRCAVSIPSNIAEGYGRNSTNDYTHFLNLEKSDFDKLYESSREIERMITSLIKKPTTKTT